MNPRPSGYEPDELPGCSTPRLGTAYIDFLIRPRNRKFYLSRNQSTTPRAVLPIGSWSNDQNVRKARRLYVGGQDAKVRSSHPGHIALRKTATQHRSAGLLSLALYATPLHQRFTRLCRPERSSLEPFSSAAALMAEIGSAQLAVLN